MGIGFVLITWLFIWLFIASIVGIFLGVRSYRRRNEASPKARLWVFFKSFALPSLLVFYLFMAFIGYSIWCELARGVDPGIGDMWKIPLVNGYSLVAIDLPSQAYIQTSSGDQIFFELTAIGRKGTFLFGMVQNKALYFVINTSIGSTELFKSEQAFHDKSKLLGINTFEMEPPEKFYFRYRWGVADLIAALVIVSIPFSVFIIWRRRKIKLLKSV